MTLDMDCDDTDTPATVYACRRCGVRHRLVNPGEAVVEFTAPDGRPWRLALLDISTAGLCFELHDGEPVLEPGSRIEPIVVRIARASIEGALTIAHATEAFASGSVCGAQLHPATEEDERKLEAAIAALAP